METKGSKSPAEQEMTREWLPKLVAECDSAAFQALPADVQLQRLKIKRDSIRQLLRVCLPAGMFSPAARAQRAGRDDELQEVEKILDRKIAMLEAGDTSLSSAPAQSQVATPTPAKTTGPTPPPSRHPAPHGKPTSPPAKARLPSTASADNTPAKTAAEATKSTAPSHASAASTPQPANTTPRLRPADAGEAFEHSNHPATEPFEHVDLPMRQPFQLVDEANALLGEDFEYLDEAHECEGFDDCGGGYDAIAEQYDSFRPGKKKEEETVETKGKEAVEEEETSEGGKDGAEEAGSSQDFAHRMLGFIW